jgi:D-sedoheptulose 7-phosphate isomerase
MEQLVQSRLEESARLKLAVARTLTAQITTVGQQLAEAVKTGHKILLFGNGGSAADAQHIAAELVNRFLVNRRAYPAIALTTDTSIITSIGNDSDFKHIFQRQIEALGETGDVALGLSTSGNSENVLLAFVAARQKQLTTVALLGGNGGKIRDMVDHAIVVDSYSTPRIQEVHITLAHIWCELIELKMQETEPPRETP